MFESGHVSVCVGGWLGVAGALRFLTLKLAAREQMAPVFGERRPTVISIGQPDHIPF